MIISLPHKYDKHVTWYLLSHVGTYACAKCGYELFSSKKKYKHSSPWPAFTETIHKDSVSKVEESRGALKVKPFHSG